MTAEEHPAEHGPLARPRSLPVRKRNVFRQFADGERVSADAAVHLIAMLLLSNILLAAVVLVPAGLTPFPMLQPKVTPEIQRLLVMILLFIYYVLVILLAARYVSQMHGVYRRHEIKIWGCLMALGGVASVLWSYHALGLAVTVQWAGPTVFSVALIYLNRKLDKLEREKEKRI